MIKFSEEEMKEIDEELRIAEEWQLKNGDKYYSMEEVWKMAHKALGEIKYIQN